MSEIFISYRRQDAQGWAGHLFADLKKYFGPNRVFMDLMGMDGGIRPGDHFEQTLTRELSSCRVLLALIDTKWLTCQHPNGSRRLDDLEDWVRKEIGSALRWKTLVIPVLLGGAKLPQKNDLPEEIWALCTCQTIGISDQRWDDDFKELVKVILSHVPLPLAKADDIASTNTGLHLLLEMTKNPAIADVVSRSKEVFENTYRQTVKLKLFKTIHDALHKIESGCVRVIEEGRPTAPLRPIKFTFTLEAQFIRQAIQDEHMYPSLRNDVKNQLASVADAFEEALGAPGDTEARERLKGELRTLLTGLHPRLNDGIVQAANDLNITRLVDLLTTVQKNASTVSSGDDLKLKPFLEGIDALQRLRDELLRRVREHSQLQELDSKLRTVCNAKTPFGQLAKEWRRIKEIRDQLSPPFFSELQEVNEELLDIERDVETAVEGTDGQAALDFMREYFRSVGQAFSAEDTSLKDFCIELSEVSQPLKAILEGC